MSFHDMPWSTASVLMLGLILIAGGLIAFIAGLIQADKAHKRSLRRFDARVGSVYREYQGK